MESLFKIINLPQDKANHALYGLALYSIITIFSSSLIALSVVVIVATCKEIYDSFTTKHDAEANDILATISMPMMLFLLETIKDML